MVKVSYLGIVVEENAGIDMEIRDIQHIRRVHHWEIVRSLYYSGVLSDRNMSLERREKFFRTCGGKASIAWCMMQMRGHQRNSRRVADWMGTIQGY